MSQLTLSSVVLVATRCATVSVWDAGNCILAMRTRLNGGVRIITVQKCCCRDLLSSFRVGRGAVGYEPDFLTGLQDGGVPVGVGFAGAGGG